MKIKEEDFIFLLSILIIDGSDNAEYFIYKFNISKKDQKRLKALDNFYKDKITANFFSEKNLNKIFYYQGRQCVLDILSYRLFTSKKIDENLIKLNNQFKTKILPPMPFGAKLLMEKYQIPEGRDLGKKLKALEEEWLNSNFQLTDKQIDKIINH